MLLALGEQGGEAGEQLGHVTLATAHVAAEHRHSRCLMLSHWFLDLYIEIPADFALTELLHDIRVHVQSRPDPAQLQDGPEAG